MNANRIADLIDQLQETDLQCPVLERLVLAKALLDAGTDLLYHAARETKDDSAMAYIVDHLNDLIAGSGSGRAPTVADWIERVEDGDEEDDDDE